MTDYACLNYPNNLKLKLELIRLVDILNSNNIHYWVDFASLEKITNNNKYLYYLSGFDICVFEDSYKTVCDLVFKNNFRVWMNSEHLTNIANPEMHLMKTSEEKFMCSEVVVQSMMKWIMIWNYKLLPENNTSLCVAKDFVYDKNLFLNTRDIEYCGIKLKIPVDIQTINRIRYPNSNKLIWCHSPKKRENCENNFGFNNLGDYK